MKEKVKNNWIEIILVLFFVITAIFSCDRYSINFDEYYTLKWCRLDMGDFLYEVLHDTSPFLYYFMIRPIMILTGQSMFCARLFSVLALLIMLLIGITFVKKYFGRKAMLFYCCILYLNPFMLQKANEIRMYGWASAFTLLSGMQCFLLLDRPTKKKWIGFTTTSLLAAYTHYYAVLTLVFVYVGLLLFYLVGKSKTEIRHWLICAATTVVCYLPFLAIAIAQIKESNGNWISESSSRLAPLRELFYSMVKGTDYFYLILMAGFTCFAVFRLFQRKTAANWWAVICCSAVWGIMAFTIICGEMVKPIVLSRYMIIPVCLLFLGITPVITCQNRYFIVLCCIFMLLISTVNYCSMWRIRVQDTTKETRMLVDEQIKQDDLIVVVRGEDNFLYNCTDYFVPQAELYYVGKINYEEIKKKAEERRVWVFDGKRELEEEDFRQAGMLAEDYGKYRFGYTEFEILHLYLP